MTAVTPGNPATQRSAREYDAKIWNLSETPEMFHRQAPGLTTRCGIAMGDKARMTTHLLRDYNPCPVCFAGWSA